MIPLDYITEWRQKAPWPEDAQVEQDLIICRALVNIYSRQEAADMLAFRGGTALYKLCLSPAARYSEDIDLVQIHPGPIGPILDALRDVLDPWLGEPRRAIKEGRVNLLYRMQSEGPPSFPMRLKIEINTREHFTLFGIEEHPFSMHSRWFNGSASIKTFQLDELMGTKLRALYQRKKGRDLFDLWEARQRGNVNPERVVQCFLHYLAQNNQRVSRAEFEANLLAKVEDRHFTQDIAPLLAAHVDWHFEEAVKYVQQELIARLPGDPWKGRLINH